MSLPSDYVFSLFTGDKVEVREVNRLIGEIQEMYRQLSYYCSLSQTLSPWKPALVNDKEVTYEMQKGHHLETPYADEFFFHLQGKTPYSQEFSLQLPFQRNYSSLPASGMIHGESNGIPFIGNIKVRDNKGEIWALGRKPFKVSTGKSFGLQGAIKIMRNR